MPFWLQDYWQYNVEVARDTFATACRWIKDHAVWEAMAAIGGALWSSQRAGDVISLDSAWQAIQGAIVVLIIIVFAHFLVALISSPYRIWKGHRAKISSLLPSDEEFFWLKDVADKWSWELNLAGYHEAAERVFDDLHTAVTNGRVIGQRRSVIGQTRAWVAKSSLEKFRAEYMEQIQVEQNAREKIPRLIEIQEDADGEG